MTRAVLLDLDGTLVDSNEAHAIVWRRVFAEAGHTIALPVIRRQIGKGGDLFVPTLVPGIAARDARRLSDAHGERFKADWLATIRPFPGARDLIARLTDRGKTVVLASSASQDELDHYVDLLGVGTFISATTTIDDVDTSKPAGDIIAAALRKARVVPSEAVMVGDTQWDVEAAARAHVGCVAVRSGGRPDVELAEAVAIYDDVAALSAGLDASPLA